MRIQFDNERFDIDQRPDECPICHHGIEPEEISFHVIEVGDVMRSDILQIFYRCPRRDCQNSFIGSYRKSTVGARVRGPFRLNSTAPQRTKRLSFHKEIEDLSEDFVEIYSQAHIAEQKNLLQICGPGYRKALEFLVKDFAVNENPDDEENIRKTYLSTCINNYIDDANIKSCAERAAWLGNDETHYTRKWEDKDLQDLKILIELTEGWIRNVILTKQYNDEMN
ncbi:hypothetical protein LQ318_07120 [Aliifodinibius salicampi]|uniref:DUF4145 domain-containing protein n=1 Tax=Fodinibius salicampi TaxID=1920655 RepID=A0ABT3PXX0_9BACT|nr:hypothetical protein [Fodinibius salicampi]MCW9712671.1 hypothetical protein [Fodinibius salicampi]